MEEATEEETPEPEKDDAKLVLTAHTNDALAVAASAAHANYVVTGGMDDVGHIWDIELQQSIARVDGGGDSVSTVGFSHDGQHAAFGSENGAISIVYMDGSESPSSALEGPGAAVHFLQWHPRGPVLLAGSADKSAYMWNARRGKFLMAFVGHEDAVTCGAFTSDGRSVVTGSLDSSVRVWNPVTGGLVTKLQTGVSGLRSSFHTADVFCLAAGSGEQGGNLIASGCAAGDVFITHRDGQVVAQLPRHAGGTECVAFAPEACQKAWVASCGADGVVRVWDFERGTERCRFSHGGVVVKVVWHASLAVVVSGSSDGTIALWDVLAGRDLGRLQGHRDFITDLCFTGDARHVASTSADHSLRVFDVSGLLASLGQA